MAWARAWTAARRRAQTRKKVYRQKATKKKLEPRRRTVSKEPTAAQRVQAKRKMGRRLQKLNGMVNGDFSVSFDDGECTLRMRQSMTQSDNRINLLQVDRVTFSAKDKNNRLNCEGGKDCARTSSELDRGGTAQDGLTLTPRNGQNTPKVNQLLRDMIEACYEYHGKKVPERGGKA